MLREVRRLSGSTEMLMSGRQAHYRLLACLIVGTLWTVGVRAASQIEYLRPENAVWVRGFRHARPATMDDVLAADRDRGWNVVTYDAEADTFTLTSSLWIGGTASWEPTHVQIGRPGHERETVVVHGNVWVRPPRASLPRIDGRAGLINRLTLGSAENAQIRACLKIACETRGEYGLFVGHRDKEQGTVYGGQVHALNSTITAASQDEAHELRGASRWHGIHTGWYASRVELVNATISWIDKCVAYGIQAEDYRIEGCLFEHCGTVLMQRRQTVADCRFQHMSGPAVSAGAIEFIRCVFEDNEENWRLQNLTGRFVEMINCDIGPPERAALLRKNTREPKFLLSYGSPVYPFYIERRSCVVEVVDEAGRPLPGAVVSVQCSDDHYAGDPHLAAVRHPVAVTGPDGRTPARVESGAILPATRRLQATDDPTQPRTHRLSYSLTVEAPGYQRLRTPVNIGEIGDVQRVRMGALP